MFNNSMTSSFNCSGKEKEKKKESDQIEST